MSKLTIKAQRKAWKADAVSIESIILGFFDVERAQTDYFKKAIVAVLSNNITTVDQFKKLIEKANKSVLQAEMDQRIAEATTASEVAAIRDLFIHSKETKQHTVGSFKTSILPNGWRTAISTIGLCLTNGIPLFAIVKGEYLTQPKSVLDKLIKAKKEGTPEEVKKAAEEAAKKKLAEGGTGEEKDELLPLAKLEVMISSMRHILAELEGDQEIAVAKVMLDTVWDLTPMKAAVNA